MGLFNKIVTRNNKVQRLSVVNYEEDKVKIDKLAETIFTDLQKRTLKKLKHESIECYSAHETVTEEENYNGFLGISNSEFFATRISALIKTIRTNVSYYVFSGKIFTNKDRESIVEDFCEIRRLIIHAVTKLYANEEDKDVEWFVDDFVGVGVLSEEDAQIIEVSKRLIKMLSTISNLIADDCEIDFRKVTQTLRFENMFKKRFPKQFMSSTM